MPIIDNTICPRCRFTLLACQCGKTYEAQPAVPRPCFPGCGCGNGLYRPPEKPTDGLYQPPHPDLLKPIQAPEPQPISDAFKRVADSIMEKKLLLQSLYGGTWDADIGPGKTEGDKYVLNVTFTRRPTSPA